MLISSVLKDSAYSLDLFSQEAIQRLEARAFAKTDKQNSSSGGGALY